MDLSVVALLVLVGLWLLRGHFGPRGRWVVWGASVIGYILLMRGDWAPLGRFTVYLFTALVVTTAFGLQRDLRKLRHELQVDARRSQPEESERIRSPADRHTPSAR